MLSIGMQIRAYRRDHKLTQKDFGKRIGVCAVTIGGWERNMGSPTGANLIKLQQTYGIPSGGNKPEPEKHGACGVNEPFERIAAALERTNLILEFLILRLRADLGYPEELDRFLKELGLGDILPKFERK